MCARHAVTLPRAIAEQGRRLNSSDVRCHSPTDRPLTQPRKPGQSRQQSVPCAPSRDSLKATQILQHLGRPLHPLRKWTPALVISQQCILHRWGPDEFLGQDYAVDQSAVRSLAQVRGHGMSRVAEQD
jgi:hypothetical protein